MKVRLKELTYKNVRSVGNAPITINLEKEISTLIGGANGSGKSTFLEALTYSLFGKFLSGMTLDEAINSTNKKQMLTELLMEKNGSSYKIVRGEKPKKFEIYRDGEMLDQSANARNQQKFLENVILEMDFKTFTQIILLNRERFVPILQMSQAERRKISEDILDLSYFTHMNDVCKEIGKDYERDRVNIAREYDVLKEKAAGQDKLISHMEQQIEEAQGSIVDDIENKRKQIKVEAEQTAAECKKIEAETADKLAKLEVERAEKLKAFDESVEKYKEELNSQDGLLDKELDALEDKMKSEFEDRVRGLTFSRDSHEEKIESLRNQLSSIERPSKEKIDSIAEGVKQKNELVTRAKIKIDSLRPMLEFLEGHNDCPTCKQSISEEFKNERIESIKSEIDSLKDEMAVNLDLIAKDKADLEFLKKEEENFVRLNKEISDYTNELNLIKSKLDSAVEGYSDRLKSAKEELCAKFLAEKERKLSAFIAERKKIESDFDSLVRDHKESEKSSIGSLISSYDKLKKTLNQQIQDLEKKLTAPKTDELDALKEEKSKIEKEIQAVRDRSTKLDSDVEVLESLKVLLKDDGIKAQIVKEYIPIINKKMNEYLNAMGFYIGMTLDENFNESFSSLNKAKFTYNNLSTGQKTRVDLALWLALIEVGKIKNSVDCNVLLLDEILENLDSDGIREVVTLFNEKLSDKNIFVISQRFAELEDLFRSSIVFKRVDDFTEIA